MEKKIDKVYPWLTVKAWEEIHNKEYPTWASVWSYDSYGESWESNEWDEVKDYFIEERKETKEARANNSCWDFQFEPFVLLPTDESSPKWGQGYALKYNFE